MECPLPSHVTVTLAARRIVAFLVVFALAMGWTRLLRAEESIPKEFSPADVEFFEKMIRPLLAKRCYECHSGRAKKLRGGLRLDSRPALLEGGDTGMAIEPGKPDESLLIDAVQYGDYQMPPKSKLPQAEIDLLVEWVRRGAPWPKEEMPETAGHANDSAFDLTQRLHDHWCWQPIRRPAAPSVKQADWPLSDIDRFVLARLEHEGLRPAAQAEKSILLRRAYYDLVGLPPTPTQLKAFLGDDSETAYESVLDDLIKSPKFAERWARHWLDLVRYADSRGHEFDYDTPNAFEYRDYVIRAIEQDVPYDQFMQEHIAGDLLQTPRRHIEAGFNESVLGTGFWFLGEWVHSPVDIRKDEADRFDNMIDVFGKTFLGLTVACARCHDHKFDAIAQSDYYALAGYLQSSAYRQVRFESELQNRSLHEQLDVLQAKYTSEYWGQLKRELEMLQGKLPQYLSAARAIADRVGDVGTADAEIIIDDFESGSYAAWVSEGDAFAKGPIRVNDLPSYQGKVAARGDFLVNTHNMRGPSGVQHNDKWTGTLTSKPFKIERDTIVLLVGGGAHKDKTCVDLLIDGKRVLTATGRNKNEMSEVRWNVGQWKNKFAQLRIVDQVTGGWGNIGVDHIVQTNSKANGDRVSVEALTKDVRSQIEEVSAKQQLDAGQLAHWVAHLATVARDPVSTDPFREFALNKTATVKTSQRPVAGERPSFLYLFDGELLVDGVTFGRQGVQAGSLILGESPDSPLADLALRSHARRRPFWNSLRLAPGVAKDGGKLAKWDRAGKTVRTSTFIQTADESLYYLVRGKGLAYGVVTSHRMLNGPLHGSVLKEFDTGNELRWIVHDLRRYSGNDLHVEFVAIGDSPLEVYEVRLQAGQRPDLLDDARTQIQRLADGQTDNADAMSEAVQMAWNGKTASDRVVQRWMVQHAHLFVTASVLQSWNESEYWMRRTELSQQIQANSRTAPAIWDGDSRDENLLIRGNHKTLGDRVPRRSLTAFTLNKVDTNDGQTKGSGRLALARDLTRIENPLTARVAANRIWAHLTGRGIVASTDNFGVLGQPPTHPELLDHLARRLVDNGWSMKRLIREIMLSRTYQMSSRGGAKSVELDPTNQLLHAMRIKRLQGEAIRDSILSLSGRLDETMYGPSVPVHLTAFMQGRGRPGNGPLDGNGRRSVYISVRRNFLSPMMLAFDTPQPFNTVGRRSVSNVPAQALILLNDPFVTGQARRWAETAIAQVPNDPIARLNHLFHQALARPMRPNEQTLMLRFIDSLAEKKGLDARGINSNPELWTEVCHAILNMKEFVFIF